MPNLTLVTSCFFGNQHEHINEAWENSRLPKEWKDAEVRFVPKTGKALTIDNMRPISLTSCVGKVMERMVLRRLQKHLEETNQMPETMYGFRQHLSTQDVMIQLHELLVKQKSELLMIQPGKPKKEVPPNVIITIDGTAIKPTQQIRILGLLLQSDGKAHAAVKKIKTATEQ
ncbi:uncharacterized protein LOC119434340, partial [Dermacentor silvarum]|uniref:uncharacterized protein LOC119434340 n=1 Tax=Dermacentor silvarum TaxID=543639 RepID=UPI001896C142